MAGEQPNISPGKHAVCSRCGVDKVMVIIAPNAQFYCLRCFQQDRPFLYLQLTNWVHDHPPKPS